MRLFTRNGNDWTAKLESLARQVSRLPAKTVWLDGEVVVLGDDGLTRAPYPGGGNIAGVVQGTSTSSNGQFTSANAKDFNITGLAVTNAAVAGSYLAGVSLSGVIVSAFGSASYSATYQQEYNQPASLVATAGSYAGSAASSVGPVDRR